MITFTTGNLLESRADALVNTVNTVGVMGKGIALMFKDAFPANYREYAAASKRGDVQTGRMLVTERSSMLGPPRWLINFPTKQHWRGKARIEWVKEGLTDLRRVLREREIRSIAIPPLGCGNGGLDWRDVRPLIEAALSDLTAVEITVYEPAAGYQNVAKRSGLEKLTPARALIAELVRRYSVLGIECSLLEVQKLAWFLEREILAQGLPNELDLHFVANRYGPYADRLRHLLEYLDGSYLRSEIRIADARPSDAIAFNDSKREVVAAYLKSEAGPYLRALDRVSQRIDGFESPLGMELLATVDWVITREGRRPELESIKTGLREWPGGHDAGERKLRIFTDRMIVLALDRLAAEL
jgi:O-acetyl-ADP-ribose deacetylase (regulator of RNase III)